MCRGDKKTIHHFYWPRKKFHQNHFRIVQQRVPYDKHQDYHEFFVRNCRRVEMRRCQVELCAYSSLCCYQGTEMTF